jgi:hypothetical protein
MDGLIAALIVGTFAVLGQAWQRRGDATIRREEKLADWARQDARETAERERQEAVADKAAQAADLLLAEQRATRERTDEVAKLAAEQAALTASQLTQIHTLVNSDMTAARQELLDQTRLLVTMYEKTVDDDRMAGREPLPGDVKALDDAKAKVTELQRILADRLAQQRIVEKEQIEAAQAADRG